MVPQSIGYSKVDICYFNSLVKENKREKSKNCIKSCIRGFIFTVRFCTSLKSHQVRASFVTFEYGGLE